jgi:hypothetical protein
MGNRRVKGLLVVHVCSSCWGAAISAQGTLRVGATRVDITPPADPAHPPPGKYAHEKLYVRAIVLDNGSARAALIGADQGGLFEAVWQAASKQIAAELNCPVENIVMSATHTHSGWGRWFSRHAWSKTGPQCTATAHRWSDSGCGATGQSEPKNEVGLSEDRIAYYESQQDTSPAKQ